METSRNPTAAHAPARLLRLLLALLLMAAALAACGGNDASGQAAPSQETAGPRLEEKSGLQPKTTVAATPAPQEAGNTATVTEPAAPTPTPQDTGVDIQEYLRTACYVSEGSIETYREAAAVVREGLERMTKQKPPDELRDYVDAVVRWGGMLLEDFEERDPGEEFGGFEEFTEGPFREAWEAVVKEQQAMDPELARAVQDAGC